MTRVALSEAFWKLANEHLHDQALEELGEALELNYRAGLKRGLEQLDDHVKAAWQEGFNYGHDEGHSETSKYYEDLLDEKTSDSYSNGYADGYSSGFNDGVEEYYN